jgi:replicative superfamily II helicase
VRARKLYNAGLKSKEALKQAGTKKLGELIGPKVAENILREIS